MNALNTRKFTIICGLILAFAQVFSAAAFAQKTKSKVPAKTSAKKSETAKIKVSQSAAQGLALPKVTQIDALALKNLLKREGANAKPLLVNFWATWCEPCREEFPELVKIDADYKGKIDFIVVSIDDLAEINRDVPKFLIEMKAEMPAYLLKTPDEEAAIASVSKNWQGGMPFTVLFNEKGEVVYSLQGKVAPEILRGAIDKLFQIANQQTKFEKGKEDAEKDVVDGKIILKTNDYPYHSQGFIHFLTNHNINLDYQDCMNFEYLQGYNSVAEREIAKKFGNDVLMTIKNHKYINYPSDIIGITITKNKN